MEDSAGETSDGPSSNGNGESLPGRGIRACYGPLMSAKGRFARAMVYFEPLVAECTGSDKAKLAVAGCGQRGSMREGVGPLSCDSSPMPGGLSQPPHAPSFSLFLSDAAHQQGSACIHAETGLCLVAHTPNSSEPLRCRHLNRASQTLPSCVSCSISGPGQARGECEVLNPCSRRLGLGTARAPCLTAPRPPP